MLRIGNANNPRISSGKLPRRPLRRPNSNPFNSAGKKLNKLLSNSFNGNKNNVDNN